MGQLLADFRSTQGFKRKHDDSDPARLVAEHAGQAASTPLELAPPLCARRDAWVQKSLYGMHARMYVE